MANKQTKRDISGFESDSKNANLPKGNNYLLTIGIDQYAHCQPLHNAVKDAKDVATVLLEKYDFQQNHHVALKDQAATKDGIIEAFRSLKKRIQPQDNLIIYYSGHGELDRDFDESFWVTVECRKGKTGDYLSFDRVIKFIKSIATQHTLLIIDACFAGAALVTRRSSTASLEKDPSRYVIASGRKEFADDGKPGENSPFAKALLEKLRKNEESLLATDLGQYTMKQTINATKQTQRPIHNPLQMPEDKGGQFVFHPKTVNEDGIWESSQGKATLAAYRQYLKQYPEGKYVEEADWQIALLRNRVSVYDDFLEKHAHGKYVQKAEAKMVELEEKQEWEKAKRRNTISGYRSFIRRFRESGFLADAQQAIQTLKSEEEEVELIEVPDPTKPKTKSPKIVQPTAHIIKDPNLFVDPRDDQQYRTAKMADGKIWMVENLNFDVGEGCWFYDDKRENGKEYGRLYTWDAALKACPDGWHLASDEEWKNLAAAYGGYYDHETRKEKGDSKSGYTALISGGNSGFTALLGGYRRTDGSYGGLGRYGLYWSSSEKSSGGAWGYNFDGPVSKFYRLSIDKGVGRSCRCTKD